MADEHEGRLIGGKYRLICRLAAGGFGQVWKARDEVLNVDVAVKEVRFPATASDAERAERMTRAQREAENAAQLRDHPNVIAVYDVVTEGGTPWMVMRLVDGRSLEEQLRDHGPLSEERAAEVATALLDALGAAHDAGIVHRDVKPANVMIDRNGNVLLADFGIAVHQNDSPLTQDGMLIGSLEYIAPERANGSASQPASDLFSLGVVLYQALEGFSPFRRDSPTSALMAVVSAQPPPMQQAGRLAPLITKLLDKDPAQRPTIPEALALIGTTTPPIDPHGHKGSERNPPTQLLRTLTGHTNGVLRMAFSPDGQLLATGGSDKMVRLWDPKTGECLHTLGRFTPYATCIAFSPDGQNLLIASANRAAQLWDPRSGEPRHTLPDAKDGVSQAAFSPDGNILATVGGARPKSVRMWDLRTSEHVLLGGGNELLGDVAFSPDGQVLAVRYFFKSLVRLWDSQTGALRHTLRHSGDVGVMAFSPDGRLLATSDSKANLLLWDPERGECLRTLSKGSDWSLGVKGFSGMAFRPDGQLLATAVPKAQEVRLWNPQTGSQVTAVGGQTHVSQVAFSPDGRLLATAGGDGRIRLWG